MTVDKTGLLALGLCIAVLPVAYASNTPDPLEQLRQGAEPREVSCSGDFALLMSPDGGPACVSAPTAAVLESRGWERVLQPHADLTSASGSADAWITSAPEAPLAHPNTTLELSQYPVVGEVVDLTVITEYGDPPPELFGNDGYPLVKIVVTSAQPDRYRVFDIVANIETGDEDTFAPYDFETTTVVADPEAAYIVKAKLEILREGISEISMRGFDGDILIEYVAASAEQSMPYDEYVETGQTYLDALWAAEAAASAHIRDADPIYPDTDPIYSDTPPDPEPPDTRTGEEIERDWFTSLARDFDEFEFTELDVTRYMLDLGYREDEVRDFLVDYMGYSQELVAQIKMRDMLASLYESYDWSNDDIINDLLTRRYAQDSIRAFFTDYLNYAPDQVDSLDIKTVLSRYVDWYAVEMLQLWGYGEDSIREFFVEYKGYTEEEAQAVVIGDPQMPAQEIESTTQTTTGQQPSSFWSVARIYAPDFSSHRDVNPIEGIKVCATNYNPTTSKYTTLLKLDGTEACDYTSSIGHSVITPIKRDPGVNATARIYSAGSDSLTVTDTSNTVYVKTGTPRSDFPSGINQTFVLSGSHAGAARIIDAITEGRNHFAGHGIPWLH